jgi:hypothetical protein
MNGGMKTVDKPLNKRIKQEWNAFNKRQETIKNIKREREREKKKKKKKQIKVCKQKKKNLWLNNKIMQIDDANKRNETNFWRGKIF